MKTRIHAAAGAIAFLTIFTFWTSTVISELFTSYAAIASVKQMILYGMFILIPAMAIAGGSGMSMGGKRTDALAMAKKRRMPLIAGNGLLILLPSAFYLASKAAAGTFDSWFYGIQALELVAGAANLTMMGLNIRDGLRMTGRIRSNPAEKADSGAISVECRDAGPIVVKGLDSYRDGEGIVRDAKSVMSLCRCGASKTKPFCDGSHNSIGFDSHPAEDRTPDRIRVYEGKDISVHYNRLLCSHAGECVSRLEFVFDPTRQTWIIPDNGSAEEIVEVISACPSGALSFSLPGQDRLHAFSDKTELAVQKDGPYCVEGVPLLNPRLAQGATKRKYVLCRCGASKNKPYCDGTHHEIGWRDSD